MKNRVFGTKLLSSVSVSALFLVIGAAQAAEQKTVTPSNPVAGQVAGPAFGYPGNAGIRNYRGNYQGNTQGYGQGTGRGNAQGNAQGNTRGNAAGNFNFGSNMSGQGAGQGSGAGNGTGRGSNSGNYGQGNGPFGFNPFNNQRQFRAPAPVAPAAALVTPKPAAPAAKAAAPAPEVVAPVAKAPVAPKAPAAPKAPEAKRAQVQQQPAGRNWMPGWLKWPRRNAQPQGPINNAPVIRPAPNAGGAQQGRVQAPTGPAYRMPPRGWQMQRNGMPPWMRGNAQRPMMVPGQRPGFNGNRMPHPGMRMPHRPMQAMPPQRPVRPQMGRPGMPAPNAGMPRYGNRPAWTFKKPTMPKVPDWVKNPTMPKMPEWAKKPQMPTVPEWAKHPQMPEWAKRPQMPDWVKKKLGLPVSKDAKPAPAPAAKVPAPAAKTSGANPAPVAQRPAMRMAPPPWMAPGAGNNAAGAQPNWAPTPPPWMRGNNGAQGAGQTAANGSAQMGGQTSGSATIVGQAKNATKTAPWWGGVVTNGGQGK